MKKYMKLIGSLMLMMCMAAGIFFAVTDSKASEETRLWLLHEDSLESSEEQGYTLENGIPSYDGYLFAGYYEKNEDGTYTALKNAKDGCYAKFVPEAVLGIKAQVSSNILDNEVSEAEENMIRFVTSIDDSLDYQKVGFKIEITGLDETIDAEVDEYVYTEIYAVGATSEENKGDTTYYPASTFDTASKYFKTWTFYGVSEKYFNHDITVTPYWITYDGTQVYGTETIRTANYCRGWFYVNSSAYDDGAADVGTWESPATLETAVQIQVNTELITPTVNIVNNITLEKVAIVKNSQNIKSYDDEVKVTITGTPTTPMDENENYGSSAFIRVNDNVKNVTISNIILDGTGMDMEWQVADEDGNVTSSGTGSEARAISVGSAGTEASPILIKNVEIKNFNYRGNDGGSGGAIWSKGYVKLEDCTLQDCKAYANGGLIYSNANSVVIKDCVLDDGDAVSGGCVYAKSGTVTISGGEVKNGTATAETNAESKGCGGNIYVDEDAELYVTSGATVTAGISQNTSTSAVNQSGAGGNIFSKGNVEIDGATVSEGRAIGGKDAYQIAYGGNIAMYGGESSAYKTLTIKNNATISNENVENIDLDANRGGNIAVYQYATVTVTDSTLSGGFAYTGGNFFANNYTKLYLTNAVVDNGKAKIAGNIYFKNKTTKTDKSEASLQIINSTISSGTATAGHGGNINAEDVYEGIIISNSIIKDGKALGAGSYDGGNVRVSGSDLTINGVTKILGGQAKRYAGNLSYGGKELTINSGVSITGGQAGTFGGNVYVFASATKVTINGGEISGGTAPTGSNLYLVSDAITFGETIDENTKIYATVKYASGITIATNVTQEYLDNEILVLEGLTNAWELDDAGNIIFKE